MKLRTMGLVSVMFAILGQTVMAQSSRLGDPVDPWFLVGIKGGYHDGAGIEGYGIFGNFARGFPLAVRVGLARTAVQPGRAWDARRVFINNNTNGDPVKKGRTFDAKLDFMSSIGLLSPARTFAYVGVRRSSFTANFNFVGGNEDFDIKSTLWGLGAGLESYFAMSSRVDFVVTGGLDRFFSGTLTGHDTSYSPDGENINPREEYTYSDADAAVAQPKWEPVLMLGFGYRF